MKKLLTPIIAFFLLSVPLFATVSDCHADFDFEVSGATVDFTDDSESETGAISYLWNFDDGTTSTEASPSHVYAEPGIYHVCLVIETTGGCSDDKCETITIAGGIFCEADFEFEVDGMTVHFENESESVPGEIISYEWEFGDGTFSTAENPVHTYLFEDTYNVCLTITTDDGCSDMICLLVNFDGTEECEAGFEYDVDGLTVDFEDTSIPAGDIISWSWTFGDGGVSTAENPVHIYAISGFYTVCLLIVTDDGCTADICNTISVDVGGGDCSATFDYEIDGTTAFFTSTTDPGPGDVTSYHWDFGDGSFSDDANPNHEFDEPGIYTVCLTVNFFDGCTALFCHEVFIPGAGDCTGSFIITDSTGTTIHFSGSVDPEADLVIYTWYFGDGTTFTETTAGTPSTPTHEYDFPGAYNVCLVIETGDGCVDEYCHVIEIDGIGGVCESAFEFVKDGLDVDFYENAFGDVTDFYWEFGDGTVSDEANPEHEYDEPGSYFVCLTITTATGCTDIYCTTISVTEDGGDCEADFEFTDDGLTLHFFETADGGGADIVSYHWTFGDGDVADGPAPDHTYDDEDEYVVCLTIVTADGCESTFCDEIDVEEGGGGGGDCEADFTIISMELTADGWVVNYNNTSTADADIASVLWYFGDGTTAATYDAEHIYPDAGSYLVCVVISTTDGCTSESCEELFIGGDEGECEADFEWEDDGLTVHFSEDADAGGAIVISYIWSYDDGTAGTGPNPTHTYDMSGEYEVCLTIITSDSCIDTHCDEIDIEGEASPCTAGFEIESITESPDGWEVNFTNTSDGTGPGSENYHWSFGDGGLSEETDPSNIYAEPGIYLICVTIGEEGADCYDEYCEEIFIGDIIDDCVDTSLINLDETCIDGDPVCGCDGNTYENACVAKYHHGIMFYTAGECTLTTIEEENIFGAVDLYPNPAINEVNVKYTLKESADVTIEIVDLIGRNTDEIFNGISAAGNYDFHFNTTDFSSGIYLVKISTGADQIVKKLVIYK